MVQINTNSVNRTRHLIAESFTDSFYRVSLLLILAFSLFLMHEESGKSTHQLRQRCMILDNRIHNEHGRHRSIPNRLMRRVEYSPVFLPPKNRLLLDHGTSNIDAPNRSENELPSAFLGNFMCRH